MKTINENTIKNHILDTIEKDDPALAGELADQSLTFISIELSYDGNKYIEPQDIIDNAIEEIKKGGAK